MTALFNRLVADERGVTGIEYGLLASFIAMAMFSAFDTLGNEVEAFYGDIHREVEAAGQ